VQRARVLVGGMAIVLGVCMLAMSVPALGATAEPGLLQASDLPGAFEQDGDPIVETVVNQFAIDAQACTQTFEPDQIADGYTGVRFAIPATGDTALTEVVISYPDANAAKVSFKHRTATARAGVKCGSVENSAPGAPPSTVVYEKVKFPKIGGGSYATARGTGDRESAAVAVEFVSGPFVVLVNTVGNTDGPSDKDLKTIARRAEQRVRQGA
jgi:hypothetical protein